MLAQRRIDLISKTVIGHLYKEEERSTIMAAIARVEKECNIDLSDAKEVVENLNKESAQKEWNELLGDVARKLKGQRTEKDKLFEVLEEAVESVVSVGKAHKMFEFDFYCGKVEGLLVGLITMGHVEKTIKNDFVQIVSGDHNLKDSLDGILARVQIQMKVF